MIEVQSCLGIFEGHPKHLFFTYDQTALQQRKYQRAGQLVAWSVVHGGPGLKALDSHLYQLMCGVQTDLTDFDWHLIPDADIQSKARKVCSYCLHVPLTTPLTNDGDQVPNAYLLRLPRSYLARLMKTSVLCKEN